MNLAQAFQSYEHRTYRLEGGRPAALLLHGFPGTPAETQPLARALNRIGWTTQSLLLPGFGPELETLGRRRHDEWADAATRALLDLQKQHRPTLLVGYSMGAAVALVASARVRPDGMVLLAPFSGRLGGAAVALPLMRRLVPTLRPFKLFRPDLSDENVRAGLAGFLPGLDLDDPQVQEGLRNFALPTSSIDEVRKIGQACWRAAPSVAVPTLVLQGVDDRVVRPVATRRLVARLAGAAHYQEVSAGHDLLNAARPAWAEVERAATAFAQQIERE